MNILENKISNAIIFRENSIESLLIVENNLNPKFKIRDYQTEAFTRFDFFLENNSDSDKPSQLLFHMATGSGKTLVMAGCIIKLFEKGYRNFLFFVNSSNILEKTKDNFLNGNSSKYLFNDVIIINNKKINVNEVENFETSNQDNINIVFSTVQGLHSRINTPSENSITITDFENNKIVMLSDEAHHINADTKKGGFSIKEIENKISWEATVNKILKANSLNILLEFTATIDLSLDEVRYKYTNKIIFEYPLKQFRLDKFSKEVQVLQTDSIPFDRALQAIILSQYRRKLFESNQKNIKPVILFKSKTIAESTNFFNEFHSKLDKLKGSHLLRIKENCKIEILQKAFDYFENKNIKLQNLVEEFKEDFSKIKSLVIDSKNDGIYKQLEVNSLEDLNNEYRIVFAVDKLNEGWDVLNLFDIVRLYDTQESEHKAKKIGKTTMSEAQLIGRGARYCPFQINDSQELYKRKFDGDENNPLRICEELYYHAAYNPRYISELHAAMIETGIKEENSISKYLISKKNLKNEELIKTKKIAENLDLEIKTLNTKELDIKIRNKIITKKFATGFLNFGLTAHYPENKEETMCSKTIEISTFGIQILRKAINKFPFYRFESLQKYFPHLTSIDEFLIDEKFLRNVKVKIEGKKNQIDNPTIEMQLQATLEVLNEFSKLITNHHKIL